MYVNSSRTVLAVIAGLGLGIGAVLFLVAMSNRDSGAAQFWALGGFSTSIGFITGLAYLVARSVSYDTWYRSPDSAEWRAASEKAAAEKAAVTPAATVASDPAGSNE